MPDAADYIQTLQQAIRKGFGCEAQHIESVPVVETHWGKMVWEGTVEVFALTGHPNAQRAYAWGHAMRDTGNEVRLVTLLGVPPIDSPRKAVQVLIASDAKCGKPKKARQ
jgi:hypothetical protein